MIVVTGASGQLGRLVIDGLLRRRIPAGDIVAVVRDPEKVRDLTERGVPVRRADYNEPQTLADAFRGADRLLLISSGEVGNRLGQHRNAIEAATAAGVSLLAYTSILNADTSSMLLAADHQATERLVRSAGLPYTLLRNSWYMENYTDNLSPALQHGSLLGSADEGRVAAATRADFAEAATAVLATEGDVNPVYELGGDEPFTMPELAAEVTRQSGKAVVYQDLPPNEYVNALVAAGIPESSAAVLADSDRGIARGELTTDSRDLRRLIGRPTTTLQDAVARALAA